jgi:hypothetical protein
MSESSTIKFLALWAAILSSFTFGWIFYRDITQRGRLRVSCYIGKIFIPSTDPKDYLIWSVVNIGKEPIVLTHIGGTLKDKTRFIVSTHKTMPITLKQGESFLDYMDDLSVLDGGLISLWAADSLNREFKASKKQVKILKKTILKNIKIKLT